MASQTHQPHFLLVPFMSQSHLIPFTEMAKLLASNGVTVTVVLTPLNAARFNTVIDQAKASNLQIQFQLLPFPCIEAGLPEGCENMDTLPSPKYQGMFFSACNMLKEPLEKWLSQLETLPNCIVSDICLPWTSNVASKFKIPRVVFHGISCFTLLCSHNIGISKVHERVTSMSMPFVVPDLPEDTIEFTKARLPEAMKQDSKAWKEAIDQFKLAELSAQGVLVNTFEELEKLYVRGYEKVARTVWCIGPLSLHDKFGRDSDKTFTDESESECLKFLISNKPCSVIFVCFGSMCRITVSQLKELALGLEASNHPFIWVIGKNDCSAKLEKWLEEENFEERNKGRGVVVRGWAPQVQILCHPSTGGFLSHCGWNSTLEAVSAGVPMITWPMFAEQFFNEKFIVQVLKIGVRIGVEGVVDPMEDEKVLVKKEDVKKAIEQLMERGGEGEQRRNRAREIKEMAYKAVEDGHMLPMIDLATILAQHNMIVTVVTTPHNAARFSETFTRASNSGHQLRVLQLQFPSKDAGFPEGCENFDMLPSMGMGFSFFIAANTFLHEPAEKAFEGLTPKPNCIISDVSFPYTSHIATKFNIPRISFYGVSCFCLLWQQNLITSKVMENIETDSEYFAIPGIPDKIEVTKAQTPGSMDGNWKEFVEKMAAAEISTYGVVVNSFEELEPAYVKGYKNSRNDNKVWCVGPVSLRNMDKAQRGNKVDSQRCLEWLDLQKPSDVIYACLGSMCNLTPLQLIELGTALEACNRPFIWVIRERNQTQELNTWIEESGFEERTKRRSLLIRGWAPQVLILSRPAIGGFLTHCGWNSTLEAICAGVPMLTWPLFGDQFFNERFVVKILRVGVSVGVESPVNWGDEDKAGVLVKREDVQRGIEELMGEGNGSEEKRRRAKELAEMAKRAVEEAGSSHFNVTQLIQDITQQSNRE